MQQPGSWPRCSRVALARSIAALAGDFAKACAELAELAGQSNAIDGRIVEIVAEMDRDELWGATGA